ncbi:hypothetical protein N9052_01655 [bacterium]|nr:hypothetical protein [bacterium]
MIEKYAAGETVGIVINKHPHTFKDYLLDFLSEPAFTYAIVLEFNALDRYRNPYRNI